MVAAQPHPRVAGKEEEEPWDGDFEKKVNTR